MQVKLPQRGEVGVDSPVDPVADPLVFGGGRDLDDDPLGERSPGLVHVAAVRVEGIRLDVSVDEVHQTSPSMQYAFRSFSRMSFSA